MLAFSVVLLQQIHCYAIGLTLLWKCNKLIVTQQELLRYSGNAIWCIGHATKENLICNIAPSLRLLVPSSPQVRRQSVQMYHHHSRPGVPLNPVDDVVNPGDDLVRAFPCRLQLW
jgi:hypothetical protein